MHIKAIQEHGAENCLA